MNIAARRRSRLAAFGSFYISVSTLAFLTVSGYRWMALNVDQFIPFPCFRTCPGLSLSSAVNFNFLYFSLLRRSFCLASTLRTRRRTVRSFTIAMGNFFLWR